MWWVALVFPITVFVCLLVGAYNLDPTGKYRRVVVNILTQVKELTPDNVDKIIDRIIDGLNVEGLNPESKIAKKMIGEVKGMATKGMGAR